jgi:hypothetical protein
VAVKEEELRDLIERAANEDWSFEMLASAIGHGVACTRQLSLAKYAGMPLKCECGAVKA